MVLCLNIGDKIYKDLEEDVKDFNLTAFDMNCEPISIPDYVAWLIHRDIAEWRKRKNAKLNK